MPEGVDHLRAVRNVLVTQGAMWQASGSTSARVAHLPWAWIPDSNAILCPEVTVTAPVRERVGAVVEGDP